MLVINFVFVEDCLKNIEMVMLKLLVGDLIDVFVIKGKFDEMVGKMDKVEV